MRTAADGSRGVPPARRPAREHSEDDARFFRSVGEPNSHSHWRAMRTFGSVRESDRPHERPHSGLVLKQLIHLGTPVVRESISGHRVRSFLDIERAAGVAQCGANMRHAPRLAPNERVGLQSSEERRRILAPPGAVSSSSTIFVQPYCRIKNAVEAATVGALQRLAFGEGASRQNPGSAATHSAAGMLQVARTPKILAPEARANESASARVLTDRKT